ncbi:MAG: peroxidase [Parvularcula sp.]|nr:peroxidase [Parvularcula sp.]
MTEPIPGFPDSLMTPTPETGFQLAIKLSRLGVKVTQPDMDTLKKLRPKYSKDADALIASSQVIAIHYQTIAAANDYWHTNKGDVS